MKKLPAEAGILTPDERIERWSKWLKETEREAFHLYASRYAFENLQRMFISNKKVKHIVLGHIRNVADVSGAGDNVVSIAALGLALKLDIVLMTELANIAGGMVCEKVGVVPIDKEQFLEESITLLTK